MDQSVREFKEQTSQVQWRRSELDGITAHSVDPKGVPLPFPASEVERILKEYASECYAVGRGESMYYLVDDLPRIARVATHEILAIEPPRTAAKTPRRPPRSIAARPKTPLLFSATPIQMGKRAKSLVAALPFIAFLAVLGLTIGLTFREFVGG